MLGAPSTPATTGAMDPGTPTWRPSEDDALTNSPRNLSGEPESRTGRPPWLLLIGAAIGLGIAAFGLLETRMDSRVLPPDAAARVGDRTIRRVDYERVLAGVEADLRGPVDEAVRRRVLDRMIDEELLVQRALELGLTSIDRRVRGELTASLMDSIVSEADAEEPSERDLERHFEENLDFFSRPGRLHARTLFFSPRADALGKSASAVERATKALEALRAGGDADEIERLLADAQISPLPDVVLPPSKIRDYVGPTILLTLEGLEVAHWSEPIESGGGIHLAGLVAREPRIVPSFEEVEDLVRQNLKRTRGDEALRRYLDDLRARISVAVNEAAVIADQRGVVSVD
jgi:hypothetical protein